VIRRYGTSPKKVVLTFDDGPDPDFTPRILDILQKEKVPAAFFVVGSMAEKNMQLLTA
jgi:peptidoglycan/xylan/chitin deacetylase (PgdA/CDA1 family)